MSGWGCPHEANGTCTRVANRPCDPGMKGCILAGRFRFTNPAKNRPTRDEEPPEKRDPPSE
ncbi:MAG: hypothetical protein HY985_18115 [Magnetospirillum sp.]|nr:hypothetical protein [Magnetospirillum sp.]